MNYYCREKVMLRLSVLPIALIFAVLASPQALSGEVELKRALAKAQYMLRTVSAEKSALEREKVDLTKEVKTLDKALKKANQSHEKSEKSSKEKFLKLRGMYEELRDNFVVSRAENRKLVNTLSDTEQNLVTQSENFNLCYKNNQALFDINNEILGKYEGKGFWTVLGKKEPFTGLTKVKVENLVQDYQYKIEDLEVTVVPDLNVKPAEEMNEKSGVTQKDAEAEPVVVEAVVAEGEAVKTEVVENELNVSMSVEESQAKKSNIAQMSSSSMEGVVDLQKDPHTLLKGVSVTNTSVGGGGIEVIDLGEDSLAKSFGLQKGDIILTVNDSRVTDLKMFKELAAEKPSHMLISVMRGAYDNIHLYLQK